MSVWAHVEHVEDAFRRFAPQEIEHIQHALDRAEREVARHVDVAARVEAGLCSLEDVRDVVVGMVVRLVGNPGGVRQQSAGPYSVTVDRSVASGRLELTRGDRVSLGGSAGAAATVTVVDPALPLRSGYVSTSSGEIPGWS